MACRGMRCMVNQSRPPVSPTTNQGAQMPQYPNIDSQGNLVPLPGQAAPQTNQRPWWSYLGPIPGAIAAAKQSGNPADLLAGPAITMAPQTQGTSKGANPFGSIGGEGNWWSGYGAKTDRLPLLSPEQMGAQSALLRSILPQLTSGQFDFEPVAQREMSRFQTETIPSLSQRLTNLGAGLSSSGRQGSLTGAGIDLAERLAAFRSQYNLQQQSNLANLLQYGFKSPFENIYTPPQPGFSSSIPAIVGTAARAFLGGGLL